MLGELLELMHTSDERWSTLRATAHEWKDGDALDERAAAAGSAFFGRPATPPGAPPRGGTTGIRESRLTVIARSQPAVRLELPEHEHLRLVVIGPDGGNLIVQADGTAQSEPVHQLAMGWWHLGLVGPMLAPNVLSGAFRLRTVGTCSVAGRECLTATGLARPEFVPFGPDLLGQGVTQAELAVDRATGLIMRLEATHAGRPVHRVEIQDLELDTAIEPDAFSIEPPPGSTARDPADGMPMAVDEIAARVPFTLLTPAPIPGRYPWMGHLMRTPHGSVAVMLSPIGRVVRGNPLVSIVESADQERLPDVTQWQPVGVADRSGHAWADEHSAHLVVWREGTGVWIRNAANLAAAQELARSLEPVRIG
jgi:hypothetical protein